MVSLSYPTPAECCRIVPTDAMSTAAGPSPSPSPDSSGKHIALLPLSYHHRIAEHIESKLRAGGGALVVMGQGLGVCELVRAILWRAVVLFYCGG